MQHEGADIGSIVREGDCYEAALLLVAIGRGVAARVAADVLR
jgi:hypothetical protein